MPYQNISYLFMAYKMRACLTSVSFPLTDSHAISPTPKNVKHVSPQYVKQQSKHSQSLI